MAIDQRLIQQLSSEDPKERRSAIVALADSKNTDALKLLDEISKMDPERKIREIAEKAYKHLKEQTERAANPNAVKPREIPAKELERARQYTDEAMSHYMNKDEALATKALTKALQINPNLKTDQYFLSLVSNVLNMDPQEGLAVLVSGQRRGEFIENAKNQKIQKHKDEHKAETKELGWSSVAFDIGVFGLVCAAISFLAPFVVTQLVTKTITYQAALTPEKFKEESVVIPADLAKSLSVSPVAALLSAVGSAIGSVVFMLLLCFLIHQLAVRVLKGNGTMPFMVSQLVPFYSFMTPMFFLWAVILLGMVSVGAGTFALLCMPIFAIANLVVFFKAAGRIGKAYDFGAMKGCLSLLIGSFVLGLISSLISYGLFGATMSAAMSKLGG